ncbi:MAG: tRNA uridine-5-carboxymethylaminomethyl(34) synthesis GTPase MnmE [Mollicutes bacterium]|nr:tRNA uridine-5-carboxymethylaminomethyl(34) synthesis GTPase MnmE [Mollicutes bacterium]MDY5875824.1 tRNA uridine-5-carboxymethylaminomethyl(34) synthesis GTPase MnmE [Bacilli bacterium]
MNDTICAIATSQGVGAIAIIRISGEDSIKVVNKIFKGKDLEKVESHTINYGHITDGDKIIDEVLVSVMKAPKTFTAEDTVEINTHGGISPTNKVLELLLENGCRLAEPGEFTKRAFLNGRIDLLEAEAVMDMINSKTDAQRQMAINQIGGKVSDLINSLRSDMVQIISNINVNIDYPEYDDVDIITNEILIPKITSLKARIEKILKESENGKIIKEGIKTSIVGRPNVGKSSLLNALLEEDKAIVTDIAGTTRDIVEGQITINGILLNMIDTAGIRKTEDKIEAIGVEKSFKMIDDSELVLLMLNNNENLSNDIKEIIEKIKEKHYIAIINKIDLENKLNRDELGIPLDKIVEISVKENKGIDDLKEKIVKMFNIDELETKDPTYLNNSRSISILKRCLKSINDIEYGLKNNMPIDMIELDIKNIWEELGTINGTTYEEELLDEMFQRFCLGK